MGLGEIACHDGAVYRAYDFAERDLLCWAGQQVAAAHASLGDHQPCALQSQQDLLQIGLRQSCALCYVGAASGGAFGMQRQRQQGATGVVAACGDFHADCSVAVMPAKALCSIVLNTAFAILSSLLLPMLDGLTAQNEELHKRHQKNAQDF